MELRGQVMVSSRAPLQSDARKLNDHDQVDCMEKDSGEVGLCPVFCINKVNASGEG